MTKPSLDEIKNAFHLWRSHFEFKAEEQDLEPYLSDSIPSYKANEKAWLRTTRNALFHSPSEIAKSLKVSKAAYYKYEECELTGAITLATLSRAAEAMDCELVYAIRPKNRKRYSKIIWELLLPKTLLHPWINRCDQKRRANGISAIAKMYMNDAKFRKAQAWSQRANTKVHPPTS